MDSSAKNRYYVVAEAHIIDHGIITLAAVHLNNIITHTSCYSSYCYFPPRHIAQYRLFQY